MLITYQKSIGKYHGDLYNVLAYLGNGFTCVERGRNGAIDIQKLAPNEGTSCRNDILFDYRCSARQF